MSPKTLRVTVRGEQYERLILVDKITQVYKKPIGEDEAWTVICLADGSALIVEESIKTIEARLN